MGDLITPWLVTDAALHLRAHLRKDYCTQPRALEGAAMALNILLAWGFGLFILWALWWQSMPARDVTMTLLAGASLLAALATGGASLVMLVARMRAASNGHYTNIWTTAPSLMAMIAVPPLVLLPGHQRTMGSADYLAPLDLSGEELVEKPADWLPYEIARKDFLAVWCARERADCSNRDALPDGFEEEWQIRRSAYLANLKKPRWHGLRNGNPNLTEATLIRAFLSGADLRVVEIRGADLRAAEMQGVDLRQTELLEVKLSWAQMQGVNLSLSLLTGTGEVQEYLWETDLSASKK